MGDAPELSRQRRSELGGLPEHDVGSPLIAGFAKAREAGGRVEPPEDLPDNELVLLLRCQRGHATPHLVQLVLGRVVEAPEPEPAALDGALE